MAQSWVIGYRSVVQILIELVVFESCGCLCHECVWSEVSLSPGGLMFVLPRPLIPQHSCCFSGLRRDFLPHFSYLL